MDPRPYHFEYRRPRLSNPTYQSLKLYESIYQLNGFKKINQQQKSVNLYNPMPDKEVLKPSQQVRNTPQSQPQQIKRHQSTDLYPLQKTQLNNQQNNRYGSRTPRKQSQKLNSSLSQYGNNLMNNFTTMQMLDQNRIYEKQEKQFNIISYQPKLYAPRLKNFPRLTLQDKIIQQKASQLDHIK